MKIIITEAQLNYLITENQKIKVTDFCGRTKEVDYQKWYYNDGQEVAPYVKCYSWDGKSYKFTDWGCEFRNWDTMTDGARKSAIEGRKRTCVGSYKDQPNLISLGVNEFSGYLKNVVWANLTFDNIVEIITILIEFVPPPYGGKGNKKGVEIAHAISYYIRFIFSKDISEMTSNFVNAIFKLFSLLSDQVVPMMPTKVVGVVKKIINGFTKIKDKILNITGFNSLSKWLQIVLIMIVELVGEKITNIIQNITEKILKPIVKMIAPINVSLSNMIGGLIENLNEMSVNLKSAKVAANYLKQQDPNAFT